MRNQPVPKAGRPLSGEELYRWDMALIALLDVAGTRRVAAQEEAVELLAADLYRMEGT